MAMLFWFSHQVSSSIGKAQQKETLEIVKGDDTRIIAQKLKEKKIIRQESYLIYYLWKEDLIGKIMAGTYEIDPGLKIPEIVKILVAGETRPDYLKVTFPEGLTIKEMAQIVSEKNLDGEGFLNLAEKPSADIVDQFDFLSDKPVQASLEGYLFPDTYFFSFEEEPPSIILKMLKNFDLKFSEQWRSQLKLENKTIFETVTLASIIEAEVPSAVDRKIVAGIFTNRLEIGMALQSDATVAYVLGGEKKVQHNAEDISIDSLYNTYKFPGLPPGPIGNPGASSIEAAIWPAKTNYFYFLSNPETGETVFSETFEQHVRNKSLNGL